MKTLSASSLQTKKLGADLAKKVLAKKVTKAVIIGLKGDLGGGKTTFAQGFIKELGIKEKALSPTFVIFRRFEISNNDNFKNFYHFDVYRIKDPKELISLGFSDIINDPQNIVLIEWVDVVKELVPEKSIVVSFEFIDKNKREIILGSVDDIL
ncbi:MAG: tRNA (adenosine(37)-N6)-threonylcarbamoyltransferase complex ATPase subunit type 1 TsaE [Candidatus Nealsonbacteria bacterium]|nr:tRNA (adenosine(37)-N6)-threonylcarbamoyltransferase complex ATPase subunit type 1 TsaE [Candidatus Nealsonbacteria bacterium]